MMTPRLPLLALAAALSTSAAAAELPRRCSADWLKKTAAVVSQGGAPANADKALVEEAIEGGTRLVVDLNAASFPCDAPLKRYLAVQAPVGEPVLDAKTGKPVGGVMWAWADDGTRDAWRKGLDQQLRILAATDELYSAVDAKGRAVLEKADAVVDAAVKLGVAAKKDGAALDKLKTSGYTGAAYEKEKAYTVEAPEGAAPATAPADMKAALSALLKDPPTPKAAKGKAAPKPGAPVLGPAPLAFRKAVIALASELAIRSARRDLLQKQGVDAGVKTDFTQGSKVIGFAAFAEGPNGIPDNVASKDANYNAALSYLTDPKIAAGDDSSTRDSAALSRLDFGLRNLIASRAAAVDAAVAAARKRLGGATVKSALAQVDRDAKAAGQPGAAPGLAPKGDLSAETLARLSQAKDFSDLNALFEARSKAAAADPKSAAAQWMAGPQGQEAKAKLDAMRADAKATAVAGDQLQYSIGGSKLAAPVRVPGLKSDAYRGAIEDAVVVAILKGNSTSAELQAALAAFRNDPAAPPLSPAELKAGQALPPAAAGAAVESAWQKIAAATPEPGFFSSYQGRIQKYQDEEHERAAADAAAASKKRREVQRAAEAARDAERSKCDDEKREISRREADPLWKPDVAAKWRSDLLAAKGKECEGRVQGAFDKVVADAKLTDPVAVDEARKKRIADADAMVAKAYADGIAASVAELHKEYRDDKSDRARKAASESKFYTFYGKHLDLVDGYFKKTWEDKKDESAGACRGLLWHPAKGEDVAAEFRDPTRDNVDDRCVHKGLVSHLKGYIGTGDKAD